MHGAVQNINDTTGVHGKGEIYVNKYLKGSTDM